MKKLIRRFVIKDKQKNYFNLMKTRKVSKVKNTKNNSQLQSLFTVLEKSKKEVL